MAKEITLIERLQLIKAGYNKKEINEMIMMANQEQSEVEESTENASKGDAEPETKKTEVEQLSSDDANDEPDYKSEFEKLQKEYEETKKKLEAAQQANISANVSLNKPKEDSQTILNNILKDVLN